MCFQRYFIIDNSINELLLGMMSEKNDEKLLSFSHRSKDGV